MNKQPLKKELWFGLGIEFILYLAYKKGVRTQNSGVRIFYKYLSKIC